jgi:hypothetical protein
LIIRFAPAPPEGGTEILGSSMVEHPTVNRQVAGAKEKCGRSSQTRL